MKPYRSVVTLASLLLAAGLVACNSLPSELDRVPEAPRVDVIEFEVAERTVSCSGACGPQQCLLIKDDLDTAYSYFYDPIEGFTYESGYRYLLKVEMTYRPERRGLADASLYDYRLIDVLAKEPVDAPLP